ncbi:hypothetical protein HH212_17630 [Massilia forsythiae]|uniref:Porin n=1 Tax=Massilia forsythiae TaxID=2728020 RepID=A0A7Z2VY76_9BURK|nr:hypothetical protein [Massilia forsythiae]QJE01621.1 hypothetical protein HH212_17630 [Massilia forsythiae]
MSPTFHFFRARSAVSTATLACLLAWTHGDARAQAKWTFGGFGTLGAAHSTEDQADYTVNPNSPGRAGYSRDWAYDVDSRAGAQLGVQFDKRWSAVVQVTQEKSVENAYKTYLTWANVKFQATPELSLRAGRIALPLFLAADYRKAGYALPWLRAPVELYSLMPISNSDGVDVAYRWHTGAVKHETTLSLGRASAQLNKDVKGKARNIVGITHNAVAGALTLRVTAAQSLLEVPGAEELFDGVRAFGPAGEALADRYDIAKRHVRVFSAGFNYDPGDWFLIGESGRINTGSLLGDQTASYLSAGYRFGSVAPYVTYAHLAANMPTQTAGLPLEGLPPEAAAVAGVINDQLNFQLSQIGVQDSASIGVRWDFAPNLAFKAQVDRVTPRGGSIGTLVNVQPGFRSGRPFGVVSLGVDFVF